MSFELIPIGTILTLLTDQVIKTAQAANDIIIEKESFKALSAHLSDIEPVLKELQRRELKDSQAARQALNFLRKDVKQANDLVEKYKNRSRFYLLIKCRNIVKEVQSVTRDIGRSLATLSIASTEVLTEISETVHRLQHEMQRAEYQASQAQIRIVEKLDLGLMEQKVDQGFANDMLEEIARAVKVPIEPLEISKELASFRQEKEEAAARKEREEEYFLEQVIQLLSHADAARNHEKIREDYKKRVQYIQRTTDEYIRPLQSFICPIDGTSVMVDPVSLSTGTACEKAAIEARFGQGDKTDPKTGELLVDLSLRSNHPLRQAIEEWRELNYCLKIRSAKRKLETRIDSAVEEALCQMEDLMKENPINKDWIAIEGLIDIALSVLGYSRNKDVKKRILLTLKVAIVGHSRNKEIVVDSQGIDYIVLCLGRSSLSHAAVDLLFELLQDNYGWNKFTSRKPDEQSSAILFLVMLLKDESAENAAEKAESILLKLCDNDEDNIINAARANWYRPLINRLGQGPESSRISMVNALDKMELVDQSLKCLGEEGIIPPLLRMVSGNLDSKMSALSALVKLSSCHENKKLIAAAGGVPLILEHMLSCLNPTIISRCSEILERLSNTDGIKFLVDANGSSLNLEQIITNLIAFQQITNSSNIIRKPALCALLNICRSETRLVKKAIVSANAVTAILPLLDNSDREVREISINLLFHFSLHEPEGIVEFFLIPRRLENLVGFLKDGNRTDAQMAAAGLLSNLPKSEIALTNKLIEADGLSAIMNILSCGTMEAKENALGALFRFTDPRNLELQRMVVDLGAYSLLVNLLKSGSVTAKARSAALIGNLSLNTPSLTVISQPSCWCFWRKPIPTCEAHGGICSVTSTFCLLEAKALPELVKLLQEQVHATSYEAIQALTTLVNEDSPHRGANVLHKADAICLVVEILNWGTSSLQEVALVLLEKVFASKELVELYGGRATIHLVGLTTRNIHEGGELGRRATRVMSMLERYSRTSMSLA